MRLLIRSYRTLVTIIQMCCVVLAVASDVPIVSS
jgi:hypothetical protein